MQAISNTVQAAIDGEVSALEALSKLREWQKQIDAGIKAIEEAAFMEAATYGAKTFSAFGKTFTLTDGRAMYDFKHIPEWSSLSSQMKAIEEKAKIAAKHHEKGMMAISDDGEVIPPAKVTYSKPSISIK
ncbi:MAG TPA: hypothetical protein VFV37_10965 [Luteibaculaceae bacterium]|nr:hypothetical protein [Luteibaculaceae bacterium]